jgi:hypothetical protein
VAVDVGVGVGVSVGVGVGIDSTNLGDKKLYCCCISFNDSFLLYKYKLAKCPHGWLTVSLLPHPQ